ncbi:MAG: dynein heavy chain [Candidatus Thorarchaeota archaeon]
MWTSLRDWKELVGQWKKSTFNEINTEAIIGKSETYWKVLNRCSREMPSNCVLDELRELVNDFRSAMPVVSKLRNKHL